MKSPKLISSSSYFKLSRAQSINLHLTCNVPGFALADLSETNRRIKVRNNQLEKHGDQKKKGMLCVVPRKYRLSIGSQM